MDAPEYLDLDEIDFSDDLAYSVTSLKTIPELCRRCDSQNEERQVSGTNWNSGVSTLGGNGLKPTGIAEVCSKFRPVKRVSPLKHQPETSENETDTDQQDQKGEYHKEHTSEKLPQPASASPSEGQGFKGKDVSSGVLFGEPEHYDLDMDEILDVPYIKSNQQLSTLSKVVPEKRTVGIGSSDTFHSKPGSGINSENVPASVTQFCVMSPVKSSELRKAQAIVPEQNRHSAGGLELSQNLFTCGSVCEAEAQGKSFTNRTFADSRVHKADKTMPNCLPRIFQLQSPAGESNVDETSNRTWSNMGGRGERNEDAKKVKSILNIVKEGQISLLPHLAVDNLETIHDENGNNLLHISASQGHAECLQHLTSLMGEDCLNERNSDQLTPAGLSIKNGHLECVRWMVSETEAIAELSCTRDHPSLIHYAACYGQEKIILWLLQFMQEQGISLDEVDQYGNSAVHIASQHGHLGCIQTLVEYGANVTIQNQQGEKPSQSAERHGHTTCSRYLVVVETCMSLASQVVKITKQLKEQTTVRVTLQSQLQQLLESQQMEEGTPIESPSSPLSPGTTRTQVPFSPEHKPTDQSNSTLQKSCIGNITSRRLLKQKEEDSDKILRQLLGKEIAENVCTQEKLSLEFQDRQKEGSGAGVGTTILRRMPAEKREQKLARLRLIMQRSLSESDTDSYNAEDQKNTPVKRADKCRPQPIVENVECTESLNFMIKKHTFAAGRKYAFATGSSKSVDGHSTSSESSDPDYEPHYQTGSLPRISAGETSQFGLDGANGQKVTTSPKSALKSPSSKRRTSQNLKLRVTFGEAVVHVEQTECDSNSDRSKESGKGMSKTPPGSEAGDHWKRPFGTFRSIMESLSGNQNNNNNHYQTTLIKTSTTGLPQNPIRRKAADSKSNQITPTKLKNKTDPCSFSSNHPTCMLITDGLPNSYSAWYVFALMTSRTLWRK
ncbi:synphilin-1-like isoform X2 [Polyodon spathula]|uniref:synphilin-1-like isoform X2 n=1 Tax=Polyodon spathula TaxID=7913 RepID=UPI001B7EF3F0|nr:synphilin-1-like isoform X2 [Polyodon spathula]